MPNTYSNELPSAALNLVVSRTSPRINFHKTSYEFFQADSVELKPSVLGVSTLQKCEDLAPILARIRSARVLFASLEHESSIIPISSNPTSIRSAKARGDKEGHGAAVTSPLGTHRGGRTGMAVQISVLAQVVAWTANKADRRFPQQPHLFGASTEER
jgi:hypothetical protein